MSWIPFAIDSNAHYAEEHNKKERLKRLGGVEEIFLTPSTRGVQTVGLSGEDRGFPSVVSLY